MTFHSYFIFDEKTAITKYVDLVCTPLKYGVFKRLQEFPIVSYIYLLSLFADKVSWTAYLIFKYYRVLFERSSFIKVLLIFLDNYGDYYGDHNSYSYGTAEWSYGTTHDGRTWPTSTGTPHDGGTTGTMHGGGTLYDVMDETLDPTTYMPTTTPPYHTTPRPTSKRYFR